MESYTRQPEDFEIKYDKRLSNFIVMYFFVHALNLFVKLVIGTFSGWEIISKAILFVFLIFCIEPIIHRGFWKAVISEFIIISMFAYTVMSGGATLNEYSSYMINTITAFVPMAISITMIQDMKILLQRLYYASWGTSFILIITLIKASGFNYSMVGGYALVLQLLIVLDHFMVEKKWYDLIFAIIDVFFVIVFGSRGPILCIASMILLFIMFSNKLSITKRVIIIFLVSTGTYLLFSNLYLIVNSLADIISYLGFKSRNIVLFFDNSFTYDSGRNSLLSYYYDVIRERPVFGYGLLGGWKSPGQYPHHLFVELLVSFGVVFGTIACIFVVFLSYKGVTSKNSYIQRLAFIFVSYCVSLFLSDSFITCPMFYLLVAIGLSSLNIRIRFGK